MSDPRSTVDRTEAELLDAIKRRREAEGSRAEDIFIAVIVALPLIAFVMTVLQSLL